MKEGDKLLGEILLIKKSIIAIEKNGLSLGGWLPRNTVLRLFDYCDNQIRTLEKNK